MKGNASFIMEEGYDLVFMEYGIAEIKNVLKPFSSRSVPAYGRRKASVEL